MSEDKKRPSLLAPRLAYGATLYVAALGTIYAMSYWLPFGINIIQYMSVPDVVKYAAPWLASLIIVTVVVHLWMGTALSNMRPITPVLKALAVYDRAPRPAQWALSPRFLIVILTIAALLLNAEGKWFMLALAISVATGPRALDSALIARIPGGIVLRTLAIHCCILFPGVAAGSGLTIAAAIIDGTRYTYVASSLSGIGVQAGATPAESPRYLGYAGEMAFFYDPRSRGVVIAEAKKVMPLLLLPSPPRSCKSLYGWMKSQGIPVRITDDQRRQSACPR